MAAPSPPFTTSEMVAYLLTVKLNKATNFSASTTPTLAAVNQFITWVSAQIEQRFGMAGYKVPLAEISGETWPTSQTTYLQLTATLGAAAMAGGHSQLPAPAMAPAQRGGSGNVLQDMFIAELNNIFTPGRRPGQGTTTMRFRAQYWPDTPAENVTNTPKGPTTDFLEGKFDPMRYLGNWEVANRVLQIQASMEDLNPNWDYLYSLFDLDKGFGTSVYEGVTVP